MDIIFYPSSRIKDSAFFFFLSSYFSFSFLHHLTRRYPYAFPRGRPVNVIQSQRVACMSKQHPNEKPVALMRRLIESTTKPNDLILDPFAGSGTTLVAAMQSGRRCMGIEISPKYYEMARQRLDKLASTEI